MYDGDRARLIGARSKTGTGKDRSQRGVSGKRAACSGADGAADFIAPVDDLTTRLARPFVKRGLKRSRRNPIVLHWLLGMRRRRQRHDCSRGRKRACQFSGHLDLPPRE